MNIEQRTPVPALGDGWFLLTADDGEIQPGDKIMTGYINSQTWTDLPEGHKWKISSWISNGHFAARYFGAAKTDPPTKPIDWTKPVRTKDGRAVRVLCTDGPGDYPVAGYIEGDLEPQTWALDGEFLSGGSGHLNIENATQRIRREYWVNVYPDGLLSAFETKYIADETRGTQCLACVKITIDCEEGEGL